MRTSKIDVPEIVSTYIFTIDIRECLTERVWTTAAYDPILLYFAQVLPLYVEFDAF